MAFCFRRRSLYSTAAGSRVHLSRKRSIRLPDVYQGGTDFGWARIKEIYDPNMTALLPQPPPCIPPAPTSVRSSALEVGGRHSREHAACSQTFVPCPHIRSSCTRRVASVGICPLPARHLKRPAATPAATGRTRARCSGGGRSAPAERDLLAGLRVREAKRLLGLLLPKRIPSELRDVHVVRATPAHEGAPVGLRSENWLAC